MSIKTTKLSSGRSISMNEAIVGLTMTGDFELYSGYDDRLHDTECNELTPAEKIEVADRMIGRWLAAKTWWEAEQRDPPKCKCGAVLNAEERHYYINTCEKCEQAWLRSMPA